MKYIFAIIASVILAVALVTFIFSFKQANEERAALTTNLEQRTALLADSLKESVEPSYANSSSETTLQSSLQKTVDKFANRERLAGIALYDSQGALLATSSGLPKSIVENTKTVFDAMDSNKTKKNFLDADGETRYVYVDPLHQDASIVGALTIVQNAGYIDASINEIWKGNLIRLLFQIIIFSITIFIILRFFVFRQVVRLVESIKQVRMGKKNETFKVTNKFSFFNPLAKEFSNLTESLMLAREAASEEARMRLEKIDTPWTAERLKEFIKAYLKDRPIFIATYREPYVHEKTKNGITYHVPEGGVVTALESVMNACGGTWIAYGGGSADKEVVDKDNKLPVPPPEPKYTLKRIWLSEKEFKYYVGFTNEALWPLCHIAHNRPIFRKDDWAEYRKVNGKFAQNILAEIKLVTNPIVLVQDYQLALVPQMIKKSRPDAQVGIFWHIPWPSVEAFSICPWRKEILEGMLGADVIGFHTQQYCNNFIETVSKDLESIANFEQFSITYKAHTSYIKPFPISIDFTNNTKHEFDPEKGREYLRELGINTKYLGLGVDRMDYTKGIMERFKGIEFFLDNYPDYQKQFTFLQISAPSRESIQKYIEFSEEVTREAKRINEKFRSGNWEPIVLIHERHSHEQLGPLYRVADFCLVTSLHDGMNLVSKEYVSARSDENGVLILSQFTGAARDMKGALIINPYSAIETSEAIHSALTMPSSEQYKRMKKLRDSVKNYNIYRWAAELIRAVANL